MMDISCSAPNPKMDDWAILDFELALHGALACREAARALQNEPRAASNDEFRPGADFIVCIGEDYLADVIEAILDRLEAVRFEDPADEERRILLWLSYQAGWGQSCEPLTDLLSQSLSWHSECLRAKAQRMAGGDHA